MITRIRFAVRALTKTPVVTAVVVLSLALGIGANTAIFSLMYQMVLRALPVERPNDLVILTSPGQFKSGRTSSSNGGGADYIFSYRAFRQLEMNSKGVEGIAAFRSVGGNLAFRNQSLAGSVMLVSGDYFPLLSVRPLIGRMLEKTDDVHGAGQPVVVLAYGYWKDRLGGDTNVLNQPVRINGNVFTVVGVAPRSFTSTVLGEEPDAYVPLSFKPLLTPGWNGTEQYNDYWLYSFARLQPGASMAQAEGAINSVYASILEDQAKTVGGRDRAEIERLLKSRITLKDGRQGQSSMRDDSKAPLYTLMASTVLVLLIAMANAANLLLARSAQRRKELAIRTALGAGRGEIMSQLLTEALLLAAAGGVAGLIVSYWTVHVLLMQLSSDEPMYGLTAQLDWPVLLFSFAVSLLVGLLFGLYPAWDASRTAPGATLKDVASNTTGGQASARVRKSLVCAQVMVSAVLLIPTGLFLKSLVNLLRVDLGLKTENVVTFGISPRLNGYTPERARALYERVEQELAAIPGTRGVAAAQVPLIAGNNWGMSLTVEGYPRDGKADTHSMFNLVSAGFLGTMGVPLVNGREFTDADTQASGKVAVVNEEFAKYFFGDQNPIGRRLAPGRGSKVVPDIEIVGVVKNSNYSGVKQKPPRLYYVPWRQSKEQFDLTFYVRGALAPSQMIPQIRRAMQTIDRDLPLENLRTLDEQVSRNIRADKLVLQLAAAFAVIATFLSMLGLYGVMAYSVTRRTREIGIRLALGAGTARIRGMVMRELLVILGVGLLAGVPAALALSRLTESQLFGVKAYDGAVVAAAVLALSAAAVMAAYIPARRATRVNPTEALRYE